MPNNESYETVRNNILENYNSKINKLKEVKELLIEAKKNNDIRHIEFYENRIRMLFRIINNLENNLKCLRPPIESDLINRNNILNAFPTQINEVISDNVPVVFHGNNNIETVKQIIKSGGLLTPEQRGVDFKSFATQIDVTYKKDISVSCSFAESGNKFVPYGAIFALLPKEEEYNNVLKTTGTEVYGGIDSVNFIKEPDRLIAIITTDENLQVLKEKCMEYGIDSSKVCTHEQFIEMCKKTYLEQKIRREK